MFIDSLTLFTEHFLQGKCVHTFSEEQCSLAIKSGCRDFPCCPVVKTSSSNIWSSNSILGQGAKIPQALGQKNQKKQKQCCNRISKGFKDGPHQKMLKKKKKKVTEDSGIMLPGLPFQLYLFLIGRCSQGFNLHVLEFPHI